MFTFNKAMYGRKVKFVNSAAHEEAPWCYPEVGTIGTVVANEEYDSNDIYDVEWKVKWPNGSTSDFDTWFVGEESIELVEEDNE